MRRPKYQISTFPLEPFAKKVCSVSFVSQYIYVLHYFPFSLEIFSLNMILLIRNFARVEFESFIACFHLFLCCSFLYSDFVVVLKNYL